jgi:hypothetical protein
LHHIPWLVDDANTDKKPTLFEFLRQRGGLEHTEEEIESFARSLDLDLHEVIISTIFRSLSLAQLKKTYEALNAGLSDALAEYEREMQAAGANVPLFDDIERAVHEAFTAQSSLLDVWMRL